MLHGDACPPGKCSCSCWVPHQAASCAVVKSKTRGGTFKLAEALVSQRRALCSVPYGGGLHAHRTKLMLIAGWTTWAQRHAWPNPLSCTSRWPFALTSTGCLRLGRSSGEDRTGKLAFALTVQALLKQMELGRYS
eukprot:scaffold194991_cov19-Tisochrysis_lutea.AAC.2